MPLRAIKQTSKTLLIEEFNSSKPNLYTLLRSEDVEQKSQFYTLIENTLEVKSYDEFVKEFMPSVWEWTEQSGNSGNPVEFHYSLEKPDWIPNAHEMSLNNNEFYNMIMDLYSKKGASGESNLEFDYSRVAELLSPKKVLENAKQLRKDLQYNYDKMIALGEGSKTEKNECIRKIKSIRKEIISQYKDSLTGKIKLALADTESKLAALPDRQPEEDSVVTEGSQLKLPCKVNFDENGDLEVIPIEDNHVIVDNENGEVSENKLAILIGNDFDKYGDENNSYIKNLVVSSYCSGPASIVQLDREELVKKRNQYIEIYKSSQEQFIRAISSAVEKMLDVKVFFEQASVQGRNLPAPVIVANCKASKLVEEEKIKSKFEYFIRESGMEKDGRYRIWFAIVPAIGDSDFIDEPDEDEDLDGDLDFEDSTDSTFKTQDGENLISTNALKVILDILKEGKITTFFNYRANETTGFGRFNNNIVEKYRKKLDSINGNGYAVFCYPNFTILPKKETAIEIGSSIENGKEKKEFLEIPGIYVDSSYVAAGLVVASQNPDYLEKKKYKVNKMNPCVRFDLEDGDNRFILLTNMNCEGKGSWSSEVEENIGKDKFGFCFCGNTMFFKEEKVKNTYVYVARNMHKNKSGAYDPLYTRLTMDFIMQYLRTIKSSVGGRTFKMSSVKEFINEKVGEWKREAESEVKANSILRENEDVTYEDGALKVRFRNTETEIDLDIEKE